MNERRPRGRTGDNILAAKGDAPWAGSSSPSTSPSTGSWRPRAEARASSEYVVSSTLENPGWSNTTVLRGEVVEEVAALKQRYARDIVVHGSPQLAQALLEHDLVDELRLLVYPVVVGAGKRLFGDTTQKKNLGLVETRTFGDGVHLLVYRPAQ
jgi:dihydrofolate reductase